MRHTIRLALAYAVIAATLQLLAPVPTAAGMSGARLEGLITGLDGRAAEGYRVHLIDGRGQDVAQFRTARDGSYSFQGLPAGSYSLGIENPGGLVAPVAAPPLRLAGADLARRDIKLLEGALEQAHQAVRANYSLGTWWAGLSPAAKVWTIIGIVAAAAVTAAALDDDDDDSEDKASPF